MNQLTPEVLVKEIEVLEEALKLHEDLKNHLGWKSFKAVIDTNIDNLIREIENRSNFADDLRYISGQLAGMRIFDKYRLQLLYEIESKQAYLDALAENPEI